MSNLQHRPIDYYAFGSPLPGRQFTSANYRYGFNGKEKDDEIKGAGNSVDFGARMYDSRLGKWFSIDQYAAKYPYLSPYLFANNQPIILIDKDGKDIYYVVQNAKTNKPELVKADLDYIAQSLNSTKAGHELLAEYANNPKKDLYITVGKTDNPSAYGQHTAGDIHTENGVKTRVTPAEKNGDGVAIYNGIDKNFEGTEVFNTEKENHFVTLNEEVFNGGRMGLSQNNSRLGAKVLGHEIGAHAEGEIGTSEQQQHDAWGQSETTITKLTTKNGEFTMYSNGEGKAKELNDQVDKVKITKKESVSSQKIPNKGSATTYKVNVKQ